MGNVNSGLFLHGECQSETSSTCSTESAMSVHNFVVRDYRLHEGIGGGKFVSSSTFKVGGYAWTIRFYPNGEQKNGSSDAASCFLCCASPAKDVRARSSLNVLEKLDGDVQATTFRCSEVQQTTVGGIAILSRDRSLKLCRTPTMDASR